MKISLLVATLLAFVALVTCLLSPQQASAETSGTALLWRIGKFNLSSGEFRSEDIDYANPKSDPIYEVGKSIGQDWLRFQPGPEWHDWRATGKEPSSHKLQRTPR